MRCCIATLLILFSFNARATSPGCGAQVSSINKNFLAFLNESQERLPEHPDDMMIKGFLAPWKARLLALLGPEHAPKYTSYMPLKNIREYLALPENQRPEGTEGEILLMIARGRRAIYFFPVLSFNADKNEIKIKNSEQGGVEVITNYHFSNHIGWALSRFEDIDAYVNGRRPISKILDGRRPPTDRPGQVLGLIRVKIPGISL